MKISHYLCVILVLSALSLSAQVRVAGDSVHTGTIQLPTDSGQLEVQFREFQVDAQVTTDKAVHGPVLMIYESRSGLFWWIAEPPEPKGGAALSARFLELARAYINESNLVVFLFRAPRLGVRASSEHAGNLDEAQNRVINVLNNLHPALEDETLEWFREIDLQNALTSDFFYLRDAESPFPSATLSSVSRQNNEWKIVLHGPNGDHAIIRLDENYRFIGVVGPK